MGYEGFSKPYALKRMNPIYGNKNEFIYLLGLVGIVTFLVGGRKKTEDALRGEIITTNRYALVDLDTKHR